MNFKSRNARGWRLCFSGYISIRFYNKPLLKERICCQTEQIHPFKNRHPSIAQKKILSKKKKKEHKKIIIIKINFFFFFFFFYLFCRDLSRLLFYFWLLDNKSNENSRSFKYCSIIQKNRILWPPFRLSKSGLKDHFWTVSKVAPNQRYTGCRKCRKE